jgi:1-acyl-sn-glycerol-3-phosphate acyltransferase
MVCALVSNFVSLFDRKPPRQLKVARAWARSLLWIAGIKVEVEGLERVRPGGSYVFVANHLSYIDTPVVLAHLPEQFLFLAKSGLFKVPFLGWHLQRAGHVPVPREDPRAALRTLAHAAGLIRDGRSTLIFPEGGRSETGELQDFKDGAAFIAIRAQVPIVPLALVGTRDILPMHTTIVRPGRVRIRVGAPIPTQGLDTKQRLELTRMARQTIVDMLARG